MNTFIEIENLNMEFEGKRVLKDINLELREGESLGILGRSGAGKTVLMHILRGIKEHEPSSGKVIYHLAHCSKCGHVDPPSKVGTPCTKCGIELEYITADLVTLPKYDSLRRDITKRIAIMLQRSFALYGNERVIINVVNALREVGYTGEDSIQKAAILLNQVNLSHRMMHIAQDLSGGEKQRVVLARQLAKNPMMLLADEPTGTLDLKTAELVHDSILKSKNDYNMSLIITSHLPQVVEELSDKAILLDGGEIISIGTPSDISREFLAMAGEVEKHEMEIGESIIKVQDLEKVYLSLNRGIIRAVNKISFDVKEGEIFGLVGISGAGKTTTSKILSGIIQPSSGFVDVRIGDTWVDMTKVGPENKGRATKHIKLLHQEYSLYPYRNVLDNLTESIGLDLPYELGEQKAIYTLMTAGFTEKEAKEILMKMPDELSEGERHRAALAQVLIREPRIVILDEPTGTMDPVTKIEVSKSILKAREDLNETFVIVSHDIEFVEQVCDRAALMRL
ncbi:MAG: methyl coenzyme M reductase system, component A2, partial [Methanosarcinales archaeon]